MIPRHIFSDRLYKLESSGNMVGLVSCIAHLLDQYLWGLLSEEETAETINAILSLAGYGEKIITIRQERTDVRIEWKEDPFVRSLLENVERMLIETCLAVD